MKITCQSCQAKYTIADEKVVGKTVKIKCKKCGASIVVHGNENAPGAADLPVGAAPGTDSDEEGETRVYGQDGGGGALNEEWTVNISDDDQRTLTTAQLLAEIQRGVVTNDSYVWKDGMADWLPLSSVPELTNLVAAAKQMTGAASPNFAAAPAGAPPQAVAAPADADEAQYGIGGTLMMDRSQVPAKSPMIAQAPVVAPQATGGAARRSANRGDAVDLFERHGSEAPAAVPAASPSAADRAIGERNENSVLFSLSALTATEGAARTKPKPADPMMDLRPAPGGASRNNGRAGLDDIMNLGGGISAAPMLAPPPLLAPVVEPPPPAAPPIVAPGLGRSPNVAIGMPEPGFRKKSSAGKVVGILLGLVVVGGAAAFFALRESPPPVSPTSDSATVSASAAPSAVVSTTPTPTETAALAETPSASPSGAAAATAPKVGGPGPGTWNKPGDNKGTPSATPTTTAAPPPTPTEKPPEKPAETAPAGGAGKEFDRAAAMSALSKAAGAAKGCKKDDGPTGSGKVKVTFAPSGNVTSATVEGPPYAGTAVGGCVASAFRGARVPPFDGPPVSVSKTFNIN